MQHPLEVHGFVLILEPLLASNQTLDPVDKDSGMCSRWEALESGRCHLSCFLIRFCEWLLKSGGGGREWDMEEVSYNRIFFFGGGMIGCGFVTALLN